MFRLLLVLILGSASAFAADDSQKDFLFQVRVVSGCPSLLEGVWQTAPRYFMVLRRVDEKHMELLFACHANRPVDDGRRTLTCPNVRQVFESDPRPRMSRWERFWQGEMTLLVDPADPDQLRNRRGEVWAERTKEFGPGDIMIAE